MSAFRRSNIKILAFFNIYLTVYFHDASMGILGTFRGRIRVVNQYDIVIINLQSQIMFICLVPALYSNNKIHLKSFFNSRKDNSSLCTTR